MDGWMDGKAETKAAELLLYMMAHAAQAALKQKHWECNE
jgi:hypothetical protein